MPSSLRVLLVDDSPDDRVLVGGELSREFPGVEACAVSDAEALSDAVRAGGFDLVITDYHLPWSDGVEVLRAVKERWPDCPVVMFTGTGSEEIAVEAMKLGLDDYVLKSPQHLNGLSAAIRSALEQRDRRAVAREAADATKPHAVAAPGHPGLDRRRPPGRGPRRPHRRPQPAVRGALADPPGDPVNGRRPGGAGLRARPAEGPRRVHRQGRRALGAARGGELRRPRVRGRPGVRALLRPPVAGGRARGTCVELPGRDAAEPCGDRAPAGGGQVPDAGGADPRHRVLRGVRDPGAVDLHQPPGRVDPGLPPRGLDRRPRPVDASGPPRRPPAGHGRGGLGPRHRRTVGIRVPAARPGRAGRVGPRRGRGGRGRVGEPLASQGRDVRHHRAEAGRRGAPAEPGAAPEDGRGAPGPPVAPGPGPGRRTGPHRRGHPRRLHPGDDGRELPARDHAAPSPDEAEAIEKLREAVESAIGRLRHLMFELRPRALDEDGLAAALGLYLGQLCDGTGIQYSLDNRLVEEPPQQARIMLYRIAQEALANARKHARPENLDVTLSQQDGGFLVRIRDDGTGFERPEADRSPAGHLGLTSMRERAEMAGGWWRVESTPGLGTIVEFWIP